MISIIKFLGFYLTAVFVRFLSKDLSFKGTNSADAPSYFEFDFDWPKGVLGGHRTFIYPFFLEILEVLNFNFFLLPYLTLLILCFSLWALFQSLSLYYPKKITILILIFPVLIPSRNQFMDELAFAGNDVIAMSLWLLTFAKVIKITSIVSPKIFNYFELYAYAIIGTLIRPSFLGAFLGLFLYILILQLKFTIQKEKFKKFIYTFIMYTLTLLFYLTLKFIVIGSLSFASLQGGLLASHVGMLYGAEISQHENEASRWISSARRNTMIKCRDFDLRYVEGDFNIKMQSYNECYRYFVPTLFTIAIYDKTGKYPLPQDLYSFYQQMTAIDYAWPKSDSLSFSRYTNEHYNYLIDDSLNEYSIKIIKDNPKIYLLWLRDSSFYALITHTPISLAILVFIFLVIKISKQLRYLINDLNKVVAQNIGIPLWTIVPVIFISNLLSTVTVNIPLDRFFDSWNVFFIQIMALEIYRNLIMNKNLSIIKTFITKRFV
jgi:hypothetical protein